MKLKNYFYIMILNVLVLTVGCGKEPIPTLTEMLANAPAPPFTLTSWEVDFLSNNSMPASPTVEYLTAPDGLQLAYRDWVPSGWSGNGDMVLFVPGSTSHSEHYAVIGQTLSDYGIFVRIIDVRGMGLSVRQSVTTNVNDFTPRPVTDDSTYYVGRIGDSLDENQIIRDLSLHVVSLRQEFTNNRLFLGGHSSGGGIVSRYVENGGDYSVDGVILCGPFNHSDQPQNVTEAVNAYAIVDMGALGDALRGNTHRYVIGFNMGDIPGLELSVFQYTYNTMIGSAASDPVKFLNAYSKPVLWIHGQSDQLFDETICRAEFAKIADAQGKNRFTVISNTSHIGLTWSEETGTVISNWIGTI